MLRKVERMPKANRKFNYKLKKNKRKESRKGWKDVEEFCNNSSIHGLSYVSKKDLHIFERIWWIVAVTLSLIGCLMLIMSTYQKWDENPIIVTFSEKMAPIRSIPFPAVTICPSVKARKEILNYGVVFNKPESGISEEEFKLLLAQTQICDEVFYRLFPRDKITNESIVNMLRMMAPNLIDSLSDCKFRISAQGCDTMFHETITDDGVCFSFNSLIYEDMFVDGDNQELMESKKRFGVSSRWTVDDGYNFEANVDTFPFRVFTAGSKLGLMLKLVLKESDLDYMCRGLTQGFKVILHRPDELPDPNGNSFLIPVDHDVRMSIKARILTTSKSLNDYSPERRHCYFNEERKLRFMKKYSQRNCELECLANITLTVCECVKFYMPRDKNTPLCGIYNLHCYKAILKQVLGEHDFFMGHCHCLPACNSISYDAEISQSEHEFDKYMQELNVSTGKFDGLKVAHLSVFFKENQFISTKRSELVGMTDFVATCGGLLGLFMGVSLLSIVELLYYFSIRIFCRLRSTNALKDKDAQEMKNHFNSTSVQPHLQKFKY